MDTHKNNQSPAELMRQAKAGNKDAFAELYDHYFVPVYRYVYVRVRSKAEAEDIAQSVFMKAYEAISRFEERGKDPLAYFFTIARNTVINYWRKKKEVLSGRPDIDFPDRGEAVHVHEAIETRESVEVIRKGLAALTDEQAEAITMKFISELSNKEIAEVLGKSEEAVRQLQSRGLRELRKHMA